MSLKYQRMIRRNIERSRRDAQPWSALVGDTEGTIEVPGYVALWYVRPVGCDLPIPVRRGGAPRIKDAYVWVGHDYTDQRRKRVIRILGLNDGSPVLTQGGVVPHGSSHAANGSDPVYISWSQVLDALVYASGGMNIKVYSGWVIIDGQAVKITPTTIDMSIYGSDYITGAVYCLVRVGSNGAVSIQEGVAVASFSDLTWDDVPVVASGYAAIAIVRLYDGQTALSRNTSDPDVIPIGLAQTGETRLSVRELDYGPNVAGVHEIIVSNGALTDYGSGTVGITTGGGASFSDAEGNPVDTDYTASADGTSTYAARRDHRHHLGDIEGDDLLATGITDGYVLTADGSNGAVWEEAGGADDKKVKVTADDALAEYLEDKLTAGQGVAWTPLVDESGVYTLAFACDADASEITYTPAVLADWDSSTDPGDTNDALDQLAARVTDVEGAAGHDPVTIDASAEDALSLSGQAVGFLEQAANYVFSGPATGATTTPTFRALVAADIPAHTHTLQAVAYIGGELTTDMSPYLIPNRSGVSRTIIKVWLDIGTAPTGAALIVDVHMDGTTIFTDQDHRPQIAASADDGGTTDIDVATWADGSILKIQPDQVGSTVAGADLTISIVYTQ